MVTFSEGFVNQGVVKAWRCSVSLGRRVLRLGIAWGLSQRNSISMYCHGIALRSLVKVKHSTIMFRNGVVKRVGGAVL